MGAEEVLDPVVDAIAIGIVVKVLVGYCEPEGGIGDPVGERIVGFGGEIPLGGV